MIITKINNKTEHPVFRSGALLKSEDLNAQFKYLDEHQRQAVAGLDGCGVAYGLEVKWANKTLTIEKGLGVSSYGHLFVLDKVESFSRYKDVSGTLEKTGIDKISNIWELTNDSSGKLLPENGLESKCVFLYLKADKKPTGAKCGIRTSVLNEVETFTLQFFAGDFEPSGAQGKCLTSLCLPCFGRDKSDFADIYNNYHSLIFSEKGRNINANIKIIEDAYSGLLKCYAPLFCANGFTDFTALFTALKNELGKIFEEIPNETNYNIQFAYDYLHHLVAAYNEFIATDWVAKNMKNPDSEAYPYHVRLGSGTDCGNCRHNWQPSPANSDAYEEALFYARRMIELVKTNSLRFDALSLQDSIRITPSRKQSIPLSRRAIPFYFNPTIRPFWNYTLNKSNLAAKTPYYPTSVIAETAALACDTEGYDFYRIEGHIGKEVNSVITELESKRKASNLPFNIITLHTNTGINWDDGSLPISNNKIEIPFIIDDLEREFQQHKLAILQDLCRLENENRRLVTEDDKNTLFDFDPIVNAVSTISLKTFNFISFKAVNASILNELNIIYPNCAYYQFDYFKVLERIYRSRLKQTGLSEFIKCHIGAKHEGGVPKGGTLILLYTYSSDPKVGNGQKKVVADISLPCCTIDWNDMPTSVFSIEIRDVLNDNKPTGDKKVIARNLSINAEEYNWVIKGKEGSNLVIPTPPSNGGAYISFALTPDTIKNAQNELTITLTATKGDKVSIYKETFTIVARRGVTLKADNVIVVEQPETDTSKDAPTDIKGIMAERRLSSITIGDQSLINTATFNQRLEGYKKIINDIENDPAINDNKAFNLTKLFVFFSNPKANLTTSFEEVCQALFAAINRAKKEEHQRDLIYLLQTATHFYLDKIVVSGEQTHTVTKALDSVKAFMLKKGINTIKFIVEWKPEDIETSENNVLTASLIRSFE